MNSGRARLSLVPLTYRNILPALQLARRSFGPEFPLVAGTYAWHFYKRAGFPDPGLMAKRSTAPLVSSGGIRSSISFVTTIIHGNDICWVDGHDEGEPDALRSFASSWRVCLFRCHFPTPPLDGMVLRGVMPAGDGGCTYLFSFPTKPATRRPRPSTVRHRRLSTTADFFALSRAGRTVGITGLYQVEYWPRIAWGAWGTLTREVARRDAVFDAIRLTEELARSRGADWFCIETSSDARYASARAMYQHYGLKLLLSIPEFFESPNGQGDDYLVYGKHVGA